MCTLSLEDIGELRDDWLRQPRQKPATDGRFAAMHGPLNPAAIAPSRTLSAPRTGPTEVAA
jgi:hypothetical protein